MKGEEKVFPEKLFLQILCVRGDDHPLPRAADVEERRDKAGESLSDAGGRFHDQVMRARERVRYCARHCLLLRPVLVSLAGGEYATLRKAGFDISVRLRHLF